LPQLPAGQRPDVIVGTSVGAVNASYLAATADRPLAEVLEQGCDIWRSMGWDSALAPLVSFAQVRIAFRAAADALGFPGGASWSMLDSSPLRETLERQVPFDGIHANVASGRLSAAAVVATRAATSLSVVFCDSAGEPPPADQRRGITYEQTAALGVDHVLASAAIPAAFPAVEVSDPPNARGWYFDGGTRLNTPIRPALDLGAKRLIVVALHSPRFGAAPAASSRPQVLDGVAQLLQGVLVDPLLNDLHTLATINRLVDDGAPAAGFEQIPYILIAPESPFEIGELAARTYARHYRGLRRRRGSVARLGRMLDVADSPLRGELLSYLFFDPDFTEELMELGRTHARRWLAQPHDDGPWHTGPL
jgi:NTE family protein